MVAHLRLERRASPRRDRRKAGCSTTRSTRAGARRERARAGRPRGSATRPRGPGARRSRAPRASAAGGDVDGVHAPRPAAPRPARARCSRCPCPRRRCTGAAHAAQQLERRLHQQLRLRPRDEHVGRDQELVPPERLRAGEVLEGTAARALARRARAKRGRGAAGRLAARARSAPRAVPAEHVAQQQLGVEPRRSAMPAAASARAACSRAATVMVASACRRLRPLGDAAPGSRPLSFSAW